MEEECELLVLSFDGVERREGVEAEDSVEFRREKVCCGGFGGGGVEDLEGGEHLREAGEGGAEAVGAASVFQGGFDGGAGGGSVLGLS